MSNRRAPGQRLINLAAKAEFVKLVDEYLGGIPRSQFIREAIVEKVSDTLGKTIPAHLALPPGRAGKGGRIESYRAEDRKEKRSNSKPSAAVESSLDAAEDARRRRRSKP